jgi:hypothetical protein
VSFFDFFGRRLQDGTGNHVKDSSAIMKEALEEHGKIQRGELEAPKEDDRALQESERRQMVVFDGCVFEDNAQDEFSSFTEFGMITIRTDVNDVVIRNTLFRNNFFGNEEVAGVSTRDTFRRFGCGMFPFLTYLFCFVERRLRGLKLFQRVDSSDRGQLLHR